MLYPIAHRLNQQAHVLAGDMGEALHPQNVVLDDGRAQASNQLIGTQRVRHFQTEGIEIVVVVIVHTVVVRGT